MFLILLLFKYRQAALITAAGLSLACLFLIIYAPEARDSSVSSVASGQVRPSEPVYQASLSNQRVAVLVFHAVGEEFSNPNVMRPADLQETFQALKDANYRPISLDQFHAFIDGRAMVPPRAVLLTFDDGYRDVYQNIFPLTKYFNYPAVVFAVTKWFDRYPRPEDSREHLNCAEAEELLQSGLWQIGGHSYDGHRLIKGAGKRAGAYLVTRAWIEAESRLETEAEYRARIWADITLEQSVLKQAGLSEARDFAFPYGAYNAELVRLLNEAGYRYLYTSDVGLNKPGQDPSCIYRISGGRNARETIAILEQYFAPEQY